MRFVPLGHGLFDFGEFLFDFGDDSLLVAPVEADLGHPLLEFLRPVEGGKIIADAVENGRSARFPGGGFLLLLDLDPERGHLFRRRRTGVAEDMGMAADHLFDDVPHHIGVIEFALLGGDHRLEQHVHEKVAELVADIGRIVAVNRVEQFGTLFGEAAAQSHPGLLAVPRAAARRPQPFENRQQRLGRRFEMRFLRHQNENPILKWNRTLFDS